MQRLRNAWSGRSCASRPPPRDATVQHGGPGWYESSHELRRGLKVLEGLPSDTPLEDWLGLWLSSEPGAGEMALVAL
jgi:hypothetical protein